MKRFLDPIGEDIQDEDIHFEFDLPTTSANLNSYAEDIVKYIAGVIVGKLIYRRIIECLVIEHLSSPDNCCF